MKFWKNLKEMRGFNEILLVDYYLNYSFWDYCYGLSLNDWFSLFVMVNCIFIIVRLNVCWISFGVESWFFFLFVDFWFWLFEKVLELLLVFVLFFDVGKKDLIFKLLDVFREDCILILMLFVYFVWSLCSLIIFEWVKVICFFII